MNSDFFEGNVYKNLINGQWVSSSTGKTIEIYSPIDKRIVGKIQAMSNSEVDEVFKQDYVVIKDLNASVSVFDISKNGVGFISEAALPIDYYFRGRINLGDSDFFYVVIHIVRAHITENGSKVYGAEFVGLAPFLADKVDHYEKKLSHENAQEDKK
jgi:hypothetical protein